MKKEYTVIIFRSNDYFLIMKIIGSADLQTGIRTWQGKI